MKRSIRISEAEWEVMNVVWQHSPVSANDVLEAVGAKRSWSLATVRTLLRRLVRKGVATIFPQGKRYLYSPQVSMEDCVRRESKSFIDRVLRGAPGALILNLVKETPLSAEEIKELRRLLREKEDE